MEILILLSCNVIIVFHISTYCTIYLLDKTHVKIRTSNPLKFLNITLLHVSILPDHHEGVNVPICEVIEYFYICRCYWLQIQRSRVLSPALPDFLSSCESGTGSTQPREPREVN